MTHRAKKFDTTYGKLKRFACVCIILYRCVDCLFVWLVGWLFFCLCVCLSAPPFVLLVIDLPAGVCSIGVSQFSDMRLTKTVRIPGSEVF